MGRADIPRCACKGSESETAASKSFNAFNESGTSGPVAETGHCAGLDHRDSVWDRALSRDSLEIDFGPSSPTGAYRAVARDVCVRRAVPVLPERPSNEAAPGELKGKIGALGSVLIERSYPISADFIYPLILANPSPFRPS